VTQQLSWTTVLIDEESLVKKTPTIFLRRLTDVDTVSKP
jgi:hypothetical protein